MKIRKVVQILVALVVVAVTAESVAIAAIRDRLFNLYMGRLDGWVSTGGDPKGIPGVGESCGRLVLTQAGWFERLELMTVYRDEFAFRVDVCAKITANRVSKQPEFEKPEIVTLICNDTNTYHELFVRLCRHAGLKT